jgi:hypothetical protein
MEPQRRPKEDIERLTNQPIDIKPFDSMSKQRANIYCELLNQKLAPFGAAAELFGSVELEIATKGEWEFAIYLTDEQWFSVLIYLINHFGAIHSLMDDFAVFTDVSQGTDIEVIPMRGDSAKRNQAIMKYWRDNQAALKEYERGKLQHAFSKREYYRWKDEYIARLVEKL